MVRHVHRGSSRGLLTLRPLGILHDETVTGNVGCSAAIREVLADATAPLSAAEVRRALRYRGERFSYLAIHGILNQMARRRRLVKSGAWPARFRLP